MTATAEQIAHAPTRRLQLTPADVETISEQAGQLRPADAFVTIIGGLLVGLGWVATKLFIHGWLILFPPLAWCYVAVRTGSRKARNAPMTQPKVADLIRENEQLRLELARVS